MNEKIVLEVDRDEIKIISFYRSLNIKQKEIFFSMLNALNSARKNNENDKE